MSRPDETPIRAMVRSARQRRRATAHETNVPQAELAETYCVACRRMVWLPRLDIENCDHDGSLVEVPTLGEVQCTRCGHMAPLMEKHFEART